MYVVYDREFDDISIFTFLYDRRCPAQEEITLRQVVMPDAG